MLINQHASWFLKETRGGGGGGVLPTVFVDTMCSLCTGLQASPSKHTSYSVRMENAVPIVTQAPGAQPLQIQPGLLTQVGRQSGIAETGFFVGVNKDSAGTVHIQTKLS